MAKQPGNELEVLSDKWSAALQAKDFENALHIALQGFKAARQVGDRVQSLMFLGFIRHASERLFDEASTRKIEDRQAIECSFCLKPKPDLVRGIGVAICRDCIELARSSG